LTGDGQTASIVKDAITVRGFNMVNLSEDILPLTDFKRRTNDFMDQMKRTRRPVVLTVNGRAELVVQDAASYQQTLDRLARFEAVEAIRLGIAAAEEGRVDAARQALAELQEKLGISG
jgi:prevent-host-death family protein